MEIQHGKGPWAPPVSGIVPLGSTLTLVVAINDYRGNTIYIIHITVNSHNVIIPVTVIEIVYNIIKGARLKIPHRNIC